MDARCAKNKPLIFIIQSFLFLRLSGKWQYFCFILQFSSIRVFWMITICYKPYFVSCHCLPISFEGKTDDAAKFYRRLNMGFGRQLVFQDIVILEICFENHNCLSKIDNQHLALNILIILSSIASEQLIKKRSAYYLNLQIRVKQSNIHQVI